MYTNKKSSSSVSRCKKVQVSFDDQCDIQQLNYVPLHDAAILTSGGQQLIIAGQKADGSHMTAVSAVLPTGTL